MQRTKTLAYCISNLKKKDSTMSRQGIADYLVVMRKDGENDKPCEGELKYYVGDEPPRDFKSE